MKMINQEERAYEQFIRALKHHSDELGYGGKTTIAVSSGLTLGYISQLLKPGSKKRADLSAQEAIARACGYEYDGFLALGRTLLNNEIPHGKSSGINISVTQKKVGSGMDNQNDDAILQHYREELAALREEIRYLREERNELRDRLKQEKEKHEPASEPEKKTAV